MRLKELYDIESKCEVVILDNNSEYNQYLQLKNITSNYSNVNLLRSDENLGFAKGVNLCVKSILNNADDEDVLVLINQDAQFIKLNLNELTMPLRSGEFELISPSYLDNDLEQAAFIEWFHNNDSRKENVLSCWFTPAAFWCIKLSIFLEMGGFDERFFMYGEDLDFCNRMVYLGKKIGVDTRYKVIHPFNHSRNYFIEATFIFSEIINPNEHIVTRYLRMLKRIIFGLMKENAKYIKVVSLLIEMSFRKKNYLTK